MNALLQRLEIEPILADQHHLAIEHALVGQLREQGRFELGEVPIHRLPIAALQEDLAAVAEHQGAKAVPLRLEDPAVARRQRVGSLGEHRVDGRRHGELHGGRILRGLFGWMAANMLPAPWRIC